MSMDTIFLVFVGFFAVVILVLMIVVGINMGRKIAVNKAITAKLLEHQTALQANEPAVKEFTQLGEEAVATINEAPDKSYARSFTPSGH